MDQRSLAALLLTNRLTDTAAKPYTSSEFWSLVGRVDLGALPGATANRLSGEGLERDEAERVARLMDASGAFAVAVDRLAQSGISVISAADEDYPARLRERLGRKAPPVLYAAGSSSILDRPALAVMGHAPGGAAEDFARSLGAEAAGRGVTVVHGGTKGAGRLAAETAADADGTSAQVLDQGLDGRLRRPEIRQAVRSGQLLVCTPYPPPAEATEASAAARWKIVHSLTELTVVIGRTGDGHDPYEVAEAAELGLTVTEWPGNVADAPTANDLLASLA